MMVVCRSTTVEAETHDSIGFMGHLVLEFLKVKDVFGKYFQQFNTFVNTDRYYLYLGIHNIIRLANPIIMEDGVGFHITEQGISI